MLQALLKGKLTRPEENMEDLLTSNVFGMFKYLEPREALLPFLGKAVNLEGNRLADHLQGIDSAEYYFWPWMTEQGCYPAEPDVLITLADKQGRKTAVLVEAKFWSGKSSAANDSDIPFDQLAREYDNLVCWCRRQGIHQCFLLYCTADLGLPRHDMEDSVAEFSNKRGEPFQIFWVTWRTIPRLFAHSTHPILVDLRNLVKKLGLVFFEGLTSSNPDLNRFLERNPWEYHIYIARYEWRNAPELEIKYHYINISGKKRCSHKKRRKKAISTDQYIWPEPIDIVQGEKTWKWKKAKVY